MVQQFIIFHSSSKLDSVQLTRLVSQRWFGKRPYFLRHFFAPFPFPSWNTPSICLRSRESGNLTRSNSARASKKDLTVHCARQLTRFITVLTSKVSRNILSVLHIMVHKKNGELTISYGRWKDRCWCLLQLCMIRVMQHFTLWVCGVAQVGVSLDAIRCDALSHHGLHALLFCNAGDTEPCQGITTGSKAV